MHDSTYNCIFSVGFYIVKRTFVDKLNPPYTRKHVGRLSKHIGRRMMFTRRAFPFFNGRQPILFEACHPTRHGRVHHLARLRLLSVFAHETSGSGF